MNLETGISEPKLGGKFSAWEELLTEVAKGFILGPLLFNIYLNISIFYALEDTDNDIFYAKEDTDSCNFADGTARHASGFNLNRECCSVTTVISLDLNGPVKDI